VSNLLIGYVEKSNLLLKDTFEDKIKQNNLMLKNDINNSTTTNNNYVYNDINKLHALIDFKKDENKLVEDVKNPDVVDGDYASAKIDIDEQNINKDVETNELIDSIGENKKQSKFSSWLNTPLNKDDNISVDGSDYNSIHSNSPIKKSSYMANPNLYNYFDGILDNNFDKPSVVPTNKSSTIKNKDIKQMQQKKKTTLNKISEDNEEEDDNNESKPSKGRYDAFMNSLQSYDKLTPLKKEDKIIYQQLVGNKNKSKINAEGAIKKLRIKRQLLYPD